MDNYCIKVVEDSRIMVSKWISSIHFSYETYRKTYLDVLGNLFCAGPSRTVTQPSLPRKDEHRVITCHKVEIQKDLIQQNRTDTMPMAIFCNRQHPAAEILCFGK